MIEIDGLNIPASPEITKRELPHHLKIGAQVTVSADPKELQGVRAVIGKQVQALAPELVDDAKLVGDELAANAALHGTDGDQQKITVGLGIERRRKGLRRKPVAVFIYAGDNTVSPQGKPESDEHGNGSVLVGALTSDMGYSPKVPWGIARRIPRGGPKPQKLVWGRLRLPNAA